MDYYYDFESFNIAPLVKQYKGKKIEELFPHNQVISNEMGEFMDIIWKEDTITNKFKYANTRKKLLRNLKTVYYIGEKIEKQLLRRGIETLNDLKVKKRYRNSASEIISLIKRRDYSVLCENKYIFDIDVLFCFNVKDLLFLDIETLGIYDSPIIVVGLGFFKENVDNVVFEIHQYFARTLEEEIAICEQLQSQIFPNFKCFVTFNGRSFDIPYIANRFLYFFDNNPMIGEEDVPYEKSNTKYHHIDLYHCCRRKYKKIFNDYTLTNMEEQLLQMKRDNELPSNLVGTCYKKYQKDPKRYIGLVKEVIEHNYYDVYALPLILHRMLKA